MIAFNQFLKAIEINEKPEIMIIGLPEGLMPFNEKHSQGFGLKAYEICCSVHPDYMLLSLYSGEYTQEFLEEMKNAVKYRLNSDVDTFVISEYVPVSTSYKKKQLMFAYSDKKINSTDKTVLVSDLKSNALINNVIDKLSIYDTFEVI